MTKRQQLDERTRAIEELVRELESAADAGLRATARDLVQALMALHHAGLERTLELVDAAGPPGAALIEQLAGDEIVKPLLVLHGLHPLDLEARVHQAVEHARPALAARGGSIEHVAIDDAGAVTVTLRVDGGGAQACGSPAATLKLIVEDAIYESAPDAVRLVVEVKGEAPSAAAFVPVSNVRRHHADGSVSVSADERSVAHT